MRDHGLALRYARDMISPAAPNVRMVLVEIEPGLRVFHCPESGGVGIPENAYWRWIRKQPQRLERLSESQGHDAREERGQSVRVCPETGKLMTRYRVGEGFSFRIDRSPNGGVWLDPGEWEALKSRNFHDELLQVFTQAWQKRILRKEQLESLRKQFQARIGPEGFERAVQFKNWLRSQDQAPAIVCFLQDEDL